MAEDYTHIWGQGVIPPHNQDLAALKLNRCLAAVRDNYRKPAGAVLEIGCGAGRFIRSVKQHLPQLRYSGCDLDAPAIDLARSYRDGITYAVADAVSLPYAENSFDIVLLFDILEHVADTSQFINEIQRVARPGAMLHMYVPCEGEPGTLYRLLYKLKLGHNLTRKHAGHIQCFTKQGVIDLFREHNFRIKDTSYSTYLLGQLIDIVYYALQNISFIRARLLSAHAGKDEQEEQPSFISRVFKAIINTAFKISYLETRSCHSACLAQGLHVTALVDDAGRGSF